MLSSNTTTTVQDNLINIEDLVPPFEQHSSGSMLQVAKQPFIPIDVTGKNGRQYFVSLRHGHLADKEDLLNLLKGCHTLQQPAQSH